MHFVKASIALMMVQAMAAVAGAEETFDGMTPACEIPIFHWGVPKAAPPPSANRFALKIIAGSVEKNQKWQPLVSQIFGVQFVSLSSIDKKRLMLVFLDLQRDLFTKKIESL